MLAVLLKSAKVYTIKNILQTSKLKRHKPEYEYRGDTIDYFSGVYYSGVYGFVMHSIRIEQYYNRYSRSSAHTLLSRDHCSSSYQHHQYYTTKTHGCFIVFPVLHHKHGN